MRLLAACLLTALASACGGGPASVPADGDAPPPIILISIDTLRADHLGLYGYERETSPFLDRFAEECLVFDRAYTTFPWTLVAHMSMLTGLGPDDHGVTRHDRALSPEVPTVAERLHEGAYRTIASRAEVCKWVDPRFGFARGFDAYRAHEDVEHALEVVDEELDELAPGRPFFLFLHLFDVHTELFKPGFTGFYDPPPPFDTLFDEDAHATLAHVNCLAAWEGRVDMTPAEIQAMIALYDGGIRYVDSQLEKLIEGWRASGLLDRAVLIITSDHGESLGEHDRIASHGGVFEEGLHVPMLVRFPDGHRAGEREQGLVSVVDIAPTVLTEAGLEVEPWRRGRSLRLPVPPDRVVRARRAWIGPTWKLVIGGVGGRLFNLREDADELAPLGPDDTGARATVDDLRARAQREIESRAAVPGEPLEIGDLDDEAIEALRGLGYAGEVER